MGNINNNRYKGIFFLILSAFFFSLMALFVRLAGDLPTMQKGFFRNAVAVVVALAAIKKSGEKIRIQKGNFFPLLLRSMFGTVGIICNFYAIDRLLLPNAYMLNKTAPFFTLISSWFILKERLSKKQAMVVAVAFVGALFIIRPSFTNIDAFPAFIGLLSGLGAGLAYTMVRLLGQRGESKNMIVLFFSVASCIFFTPFMIAGYVPMTLYQLAMLILAGVSAAFGQFTVTTAYFYAPASEISVYDYTAVIFSALWGLLFFNQMPDFINVIGYIIIAGAAIYNRKLAMEN